MNFETVLTHALTAVLLFLVLTLSLGYFLGHPVLLSYAESDSMEPTIGEGDGFFIMPSPIAGPVNVDDVVTFQAERVHGGQITTHRVVAETDTGYVTKGDANPFTDQDNGEPAVTDGQVVGKVLTFDGEPVTVPGVGTYVEGTQSAVSSFQQLLASSLGTGAVMGPQGLAYLLFAAGILLFFISLVFGGGRYGREKMRDEDRDAVFSTWTVVLVAAFFIVLILTATMLTQGGSTKYEVVSSESNPDTPRVVPAGESVDRKYVLTNPGYIPVVSYIEPGSRGVEVNEEYRENYLRENESVNATVTFTAPEELGYYPMYVVERRYFAVLPTPVIRGLYRIHPWVPLVAINGLVAGTFVVFSAILVGTKPVRTRTREASAWLGKRKGDKN